MGGGGVSKSSFALAAVAAGWTRERTAGCRFGTGTATAAAAAEAGGGGDSGHDFGRFVGGF